MAGYYINSVSARDYSVVMGITVRLSVIIIVGNRFVGILYGYLDPRTRAKPGPELSEPPLSRLVETPGKRIRRMTWVGV